jgi:zinc finger SWIM domain-containing protein 3
MHSLSDSMDSLKRNIIIRWSELQYVDFDMSCLKNGQTKIIETDLDLQSLCSLHIITRSPCFEITIGSVSSSKSLSLDLPSSVSSAGTSLALAIESDNVYSLHTKDWECLLKSVGQRFDGGADEFRIALRKYSFQHGFKTIFLKNDAKRVTARCVGHNTINCTWFIHAATSPGIKKTLFVIFFVNEHCCDLGIRDITKVPLSSKLIKSLVIEEVRDKHDILPKDIQNSVRRNFGMHANYYFAHKARELASEEVYGSHAESFSRIPAYVENLRHSNPGSHVVLEVDEMTKKFQRIFIAFEACIHGFQFVRPMVYLDGTFLKGKFKGCLLAATCLDGQDGKHI